jgi:hypothetical protein
MRRPRSISPSASSRRDQRCPHNSERVDHRNEFAACPRQLVGERPCVAGALALNDTLGFELLQPPRQQRRRHQRYAALQLGEARRAPGEVADDQRRPFLAEQLGGLGDRAKLTVSFHREPPLLEWRGWSRKVATGFSACPQVRPDDPAQNKELKCDWRIPAKAMAI